jgi:hypothetical protein
MLHNQSGHNPRALTMPAVVPPMPPSAPVRCWFTGMELIVRSEKGGLTLPAWKLSRSDVLLWMPLVWPVVLVRGRGSSELLIYAAGGSVKVF